MEYGIWNMEYGIWNMEYGKNNCQFGIVEVINVQENYYPNPLLFL